MRPRHRRARLSSSIPPLVGAAVTLLQWVAAAMAAAEPLRRNPVERGSGVSVLETAEPWALTYGRRRTRHPRCVTRSFADRSGLLDAAWPVTPDGAPRCGDDVAPPSCGRG